MPEYRKKPVVIEARRVPVLSEASDLLSFVRGVNAVADWCGGTWRGGFKSTNEQIDPSVPRGVRIETLEGKMVASEGDWVIRGVAGEFYPCKPSIFEATYEPINEPEGESPT